MAEEFQFSEEEVTGTLEGWSYFPGYNVVGGTLQVDAKGRFRDGQFVYTSDIRRFWPSEEDPQYAVTRNSVYKLGERA